MATAKKQPSGKWKVRVYDYTDAEGKQHYKAFTASTKKEAERMGAAYQHQDTEVSMSFEELMDTYLAIKDNVLSPSTLRSYKSMSKYLKKTYPKFCRNTDIKQKDVQDLINSLAKDHKPKSVKNYNGFISSVLGDSRRFKITLPQSIKHTYRIPTEAEFKALMAYVKDTPMEVPIMLGSYCMMRRSEICGLKISDIDGDVIHIHQSMVKNSNNDYEVKTTKTVSSDRYIQAPGFVVEKIRSQGYVTEMTPAAISDAFRKLVVKLDLTGMRFHDLRHWGASYRHSLGIPNAAIQKDGGWSNEATLTNIYRHVLDDERAKYSEKINKAFQDLMT